MRHPFRLLPLALLAGLAACAEHSPLDPQSGPSFAATGAGAQQITVLTRNMYIGADVDPVIEALIYGTPGDVFTALQAALGQLQRTDFPTRIAALADEIARQHPDVVGLQEVYNLDIVPAALGLPGGPIHMDFLGTLQAALAARGVTYVVAGTNTLTDAVLAGGAVHLTDHDALLVNPARVTLAGPGTGAVFQVNLADYLPPGSIAIVRGYVYVPALVAGVPTLLINSHLESGPGTLFEQLRYAQAYELAQVAAQSPNVILTGDLNDVPGSLMYQVMAGAGLTDTWLAMRPGAAGLTCCQLPDLSNHVATFDQRIDYVWTKGFAGPSGNVQGSVTLLDAQPSSLLDGTVGSVWPSDHAGLLAPLLLPGVMPH